DPEDGSKEKAGEAGGAARVQAEEQQPEAEREGKDRSDGGRFGAVARVEVAAGPSDAERGSQAKDDETEDWRYVEEDARRGTREPDLRKHVGCEALAAQDDEVPRRSGKKRDQSARDEGVLHEVKLQEQLDVGQEIPRGALMRHLLICVVSDLLVLYVMDSGLLRV